MRIASRLKLAAMVPALMAMVIGLTLLLSYTAMKEAQERDATAQRISSGMQELNSFAFSYVLYHENGRSSSSFWNTTP